MQDFRFYILIIVAIVVGIVIFKKIAGCLLRSILLLAIIGALVYIYITYFAHT